MVYCDPPYNIGLDYTKGIGNSGKYGGSYTGKADSKTNLVYADFIASTMENAVASSKKNSHFFYWCDQKYIWIMQTLMIQRNIEPKRVCLWIKNSANPTPAIAFNKVYEPCVYGTRGKPDLNPNLRNATEVLNPDLGNGTKLHEDLLDMTDLWVVKRDQTTEYEHPTQKPITLNEKPMKRCTRPGDLILDLFGGSGSTMIAAQQIGRRAYLMEADPIFSTVIIKRWETFTGKKAKKL